VIKTYDINGRVKFEKTASSKEAGGLGAKQQQEQEYQMSGVEKWVQIERLKQEKRDREEQARLEAELIAEKKKNNPDNKSSSAATSVKRPLLRWRPQFMTRQPQTTSSRKEEVNASLHDASHGDHGVTMNSLLQQHMKDNVKRFEIYLERNHIASEQDIEDLSRDQEEELIQGAIQELKLRPVIANRFREFVHCCHTKDDKELHSVGSAI
jgi:hypothetical protein